MKAHIVGTGLIGGSIGLGLRASGWEVSGEDADGASEAAARELGAIEATLPSGDPDLVVVCVPVGSMSEVMRTHVLWPHCVVTDVGSTKTNIVASGQQLFSERFVGGHPMAGTEGEGISAARADLYKDATWILTPTELTGPTSYRTVNKMVADLGARVVALSPSEHDRLVALVSHLPYLISTAVAACASRADDDLVYLTAAGGFRDLTRTAGSNPRVWLDILTSNREFVLRELERFREVTAELTDAVRSGDVAVLGEAMTQARDARERMPMKGSRLVLEPHVVDVSIPDRAGVLADVTTTVGAAGVNIEDLWIDHNGSVGVVRLVVGGASDAQVTKQALEGAGFTATILERDV